MIKYLVSLKNDELRRNIFSTLFEKNYSSIRLIYAINGKNIKSSIYFEYLKKYYLSYCKIITPSELGCTLSHINILKNFLSTAHSHALILEDDVRGGDEDILKVEEITKILPENSIVILGGQQGLGFNKYIYGKTYINKNLYKISNFSMKFISRSCCYLVDKKSAATIVEKLENNLEIIDHWHKIFRQSNVKFYYYPLFEHPIELSSSNIEQERAVFYIDSFWKRIKRDGVFKKIFNRIFNDIGVIYSIFKGYKKIENYEDIRKN